MRGLGVSRPTLRVPTSTPAAAWKRDWRRKSGREVVWAIDGDDVDKCGGRGNGERLRLMRVLEVELIGFADGFLVEGGSE